MAATGSPHPVFHGLVYGSMLVANTEIQAACDRAALDLPAIIERIRLIDQPTQTCRDCGGLFPYDPGADRCPACVAEQVAA